MASKGNLIIVEDDQPIVQQIEYDLSNAGYTCFRSGVAITRADDIIRRSPDAVLLGLTHWDDDRLDLCESMTKNDLFPDDIPVLAMITEDNLRKIPKEFRFSDVLVIPYRIGEMEFRLSRMLYYYRAKTREQETIEIDNISISLASYEVRVKDKLLALTLKEYELLIYLVRNRGRVFTREALLNTIWGLDYYGGTRTVDVHIRRLRAKLGDIDETYVKTVRGVGYTFRASR